MKHVFLILIVFLVQSNHCLFSQTDLGNVGNVDLEHLGSNWKQKISNFKLKDACRISGGITANSVFYSSSEDLAGRAPFTYFLQGNINLGFLSWSMPISYQYTNQGSNLGYQIPFSFNRFSISPKYKWVQAHIGDVTMTFSPYTLNGLQFTGAGLELTPKIPLKISIMGGRFQKAIQYSTNTRSIPAYKRIGYGAKLDWKTDRYTFGVIGFYAKDDSSSLHTYPQDSSQLVLPHENLVVGMNSNFRFGKGFEFYAQYANSAMIEDQRHQYFSHNQAYKTGLKWKIDQFDMGVEYEHVDPLYRTLGSYYFNNDLENTTMNVKQSLFNKKMQLALRLGYQHNDLDHSKASKTGRMVGSINISATPSQRVQIELSASNFTTFTNRKLDQFATINNPNYIDDPNNLDYKQITKNASLNLSYLLTKGEKTNQTLNLNYSVNDVANQQGGVVHSGQGATVQNAVLGHQLTFKDMNLSVNSSLNYTYNSVGFSKSQTYGGNLGLSKTFLKGQLVMSGSGGYNRSRSELQQTSNTNIQFQSVYSFLKRNSLTLSAIQMIRSMIDTTNNERTITLGYAYHF